MAPKVRAFKIVYPHRFKDGRSVPRSQYYTTSDPAMIENLIRSQGAQELEPGSAPVAAPPTKVEAEKAAIDAAALAAANGDPDAETEPKPDFDRFTKSNLRHFLDFCGRDQPRSSVNHGTLVSECNAVWEAGLRPSPFYGLPGGPVPSEGMPGPDASDADLIERQIAFAEEHGVDVPDETRAAVVSIRAAAKAADQETEGLDPIEPTGDEGDAPGPAGSDSEDANAEAHEAEAPADETKDEAEEAPSDAGEDTPEE